ncbi:uncharacterized protein LOC131091930 [Melospiza georgiana]|uniref:uncharacterized protein LOC131091930 n=1 Tax=Melospiza georgiana TaxID=44398 RepID=UPI0025ACA51A|nr:uncharacterized protein LOC131091930 [Melospiza georgiana]
MVERTSLRRTNPFKLFFNAEIEVTKIYLCNPCLHFACLPRWDVGCLLSQCSAQLPLPTVCSGTSTNYTPPYQAPRKTALTTTVQRDSYHTGNLWQKQGYDLVPQSCTHALIMKTCSLLCSCLLHSLCPSNSCKSTGCREHIPCYCAVLRPPAPVLSAGYTTREATENSLCPKESHTVPSAPPPAQCTRALVLFSASYATRRVGCMGAMGFPIQFLRVIRPGCSCSERQDQGKLF